MSPKRPRSPSTASVRTRTLDPRGYALGEEIDGDGEVAVWGALPGERVTVEIRGGGQKRRWGVATAWQERHPGRVDPPCPVADRCGGCSVQFASRGTQLEQKRERVVRAFRAAGLGEHEVPDCESVGPALGYRSKYQPMARWTEGAGLELGLFEAHSHDLVPLDSCPAQDEPTQLAAQAVLRVLRASGRAMRWLRAILVRSNGSRALVTLLTHPGESRPDEAELRAWAQEICAQAPVDGLALNVTPPTGNALVGAETRPVFGASDLVFAVADTEFRAGPVSFVQANLAAAEEMVLQIRQWAGRGGQRSRALDLYAGVGMFAGALGSLFGRVVAVEAAPSAAEWCRMNLGARPGFSVVEAPVHEALATLGSADFVVADPPRAGLGEAVVRSLADVVRPSRMALVSCWPESCARDLVALLREGYAVAEIRLLDLFPQTLHVEILVELVRIAKEGGPVR